MAKPPTSVRSIRLPDETWAWLANEAERRKTTINALMAALVAEMRSGIVVTKPKSSEPKAEVPTPTVKSIADSVPLAGTFKRPVYQKGQKK